MKIWTGDPQTWGPAPADGTAITIGVFDGVHRGHQAVLSDVAERADELGEMEQVALTFDVHPRAVISPSRAPKMLTTVTQRIEMLETLGMDHVGILPFEEIRTSSPEGFVSKVLVGAFNARLVAVGTDFRYGADRAGDVSTLRRAGMGYGFEVDAVDLLEEDTGPISSTTIRTMLATGEVVEAAELLGRPYELRGEVVEGDQRGRTIGFPTANLVFGDDHALPANGVYAVRTEVNGVVRDAVSNVGVRPTFGGESVVVEVHLFDFDGDLYGREMKVWFIDRIRDEERFDGLDALVTQICLDAEAARRMLS
jgi:riboflavin kinase/FMN adenylyltransferase